MPSSTALRMVGMPRSTRCSTSTAMLRTVLSVLMVYAAQKPSAVSQLQDTEQQHAACRQVVSSGYQSRHESDVQVTGALSEVVLSAELPARYRAAQPQLTAACKRLLADMCRCVEQEPVLQP